MQVLPQKTAAGNRAVEYAFQYYLENHVFVWMHAAVLAVALAVLAMWYAEVIKIRRQKPPASETLFRRMIAPLEPYAQYFDFCSSAFIFVGLLGTISGFIKGIPDLRQFDYSFRDIQRALSTSGAGILLSLLYNALTLVLDLLFARPVLNTMRAAVEGDALELSVREHLGRIDTTLVSTMETFRTSTENVTATVREWNDKIGSVRQEYGEIAAQIKVTGEQFASTYEALRQLPGAIRSDLESVFSDSRKSLKAVLDSIEGSLRALEALPGTVERGLDDSFAQRKRVLDEALAEYRRVMDQQRQRLDEIYAQTSEIPRKLSETLEVGGRKNVDILQASLTPFLEELRRTARSAVEEQMVVLGEAAGKLQRSAGELQSRWDAVLAREQQALSDAMANALMDAARLVEQQRENLLRIEAGLPDSLARTFTELIQRTQDSSRALVDATAEQNRATAAVREATRSMDAALAEIAALLRRTPPAPPAGLSPSRPTPIAVVPVPRNNPPQAAEPPGELAGTATDGLTATQRPKQQSTVAMGTAAEETTLPADGRGPQNGSRVVRYWSDYAGEEVSFWSRLRQRWPWGRQ
jgi:hypothetical protein